jgi:general secretion pathway protein D
MELAMKKIIYSLCIVWFTTCSIQAKKEDIFYFQFDNEELVDIVHRLAAKKEVNVIFPVKSPLYSRITMFMDDPFTLDQAWEKLYTLLDLAGYSLIDKDLQYTIVKNEATIYKEALPIYIGTPPEKIPDSDERIRYVYYLKNLKVSENFDTTDLGKIVKDILQENSVLADQQTNCLILTEKANNIKALMEIITRLDSAALQETFEVIPLHNINPDKVRLLFDDILNTKKEPYRLETKKQLSENSYFPKNVRTYTLPRSSSLLVVGTQMAIDRIRDFIVKYIDVELESGKSILHIYKLQYMDANEIKKVLGNVLHLDGGGTGQSAGDAAKNPVSPEKLERVFDQIIIETDLPEKGAREGSYYGNNNLIIACRNDDWVRIKSLIEQLDQAQPQVIIEVLIANLTLQEVRNLGAISCNPAELNFPPGVNMQMAQLGGGVIINPNPPNLTSTLATDLMASSTANVPPPPPNSGLPTPPNPASVVKSMDVGSTAIAINNGTMGENGTLGSAWSVLQLLDLFSYSKVISHPHLIATQGTEAKIEIGQTRLINDQTTGSGGGTTVVKLKDIGAMYKVNIKPTIYTSDTPGGKDDAVRLKVRVDIQDFLPGANTNNARLTRMVETSALLKNGQILALGGLIDHEVDDSINQTPILSKIPILGWLTKWRGTSRTDSNLTIFIAPTIIEPRLRGGTSQYTKDYVAITKKYSDEAELFDSLQDPVTRWFFKRTYDPQAEIKDFMDQDEFKRVANNKEYKNVVDVEQAASPEEMNDAPKNEKKAKSKRIVLSNLDEKGKPKEDTAKADALRDVIKSSVPEPTTKVASATHETPVKTASPIDDILTTQPTLQPEEMRVASANSPLKQEAHRAMLKEKLQKILETEDNPLL